GHLLHFNNRYAFDLIKSLLGSNLAEHQRSAWIYTHGRYIPYPFQANLYKLPKKVKQECLSGLIRAAGTSPRKQKNNFLGWIEGNFGQGIAKNFLIPYNTKFWTIPLQEMTCEWLDGFIPVPSLSQMLAGAVKASKDRFGYNVKFWYPKKGGIASLSNALASSVKNIYTGCKVTGIDLARKEITFSGSEKEKFDYLISTIPLPEIPALTRALPGRISNSFSRLRWNSVFNLNLGIDRKSDKLKHWVYFPEKKIPFFRVGFFHNFSAYLAPQSKGSLYIEVSYPQDKEINGKMISRAKDALRKTGILNNAKICIQDINRIKYAYPIYDHNYALARSNILQFLRQKNIFSCGRYGSWRYLSMQGVILEARAAAKEVYGCLSKK
ncbi:MAG: FAD-dependent oxidoreductase, partial [Candidatus Omnitrophica bacterium]|nr:FAD-dependent oxidoreductase [Candidatus Omnitrophota bacterium]